MNADIVYATSVLALEAPRVDESSVPLVSVSVMCLSCKGLKTGPMLSQPEVVVSRSPYLWTVKLTIVSDDRPLLTPVVPST